MFAWTRSLLVHARHHSNDFDKRTKGESYISNELLCFWVHKVVFKAGFSWLETCLVSFALHYCSFMLHLHHISVYTGFFAEQNLSRLEFCLATQCKNTHCLLPLKFVKLLNQLVLSTVVLWIMLLVTVHGRKSK